MRMMRFLRTVLLLVASLSLTAFSCSKKKTIGDPYMLFEVHGTVYGDHKVADESTPQEGDSVLVTLPVKGIRVTSGNSEAVYTGSDGSFVIYGRSVPGSSVSLVFTDEDRYANGGPYQKQSKTVILRQRDAGDDLNYRGYWFASEVEVKMLLKNESLNPDPSLPTSSDTC